MGTLVNTFVMLSFATCNIGGGFLLPADRDFEGQKVNETWRIIFGFPIAVSIVMSLLYACVIKDRDSIFYNLSLGTEEAEQEALSLIKDVYTEDEDHCAILNELKAQTFSKSSSTTIATAMCDKSHWKATLIGFTLSLLFKQCGFDALIMFSNRMIN